MAQKKTIALVYPNQKWQKDDFQTNWNLNPSLLCLLGAMVEDDVNVVIIDAQFYDLSIPQFVERIREVDPDFIGISALSTEYKGTLHSAAQALKDEFPDKIIIAGGVHVTIEYRDVMSDPNIDFAVIGDGEYVLRDLIRFLLGKGQRPQVGLAYREEDGKLVTQLKSTIADLDKLPMPNYDLVKLEDYVNVGPRTGPLRPPEMPYVRLIITRGCPVGCSFCQVEEISGKKVRAPSAEKVIKELLYMKEHYGIKSVMIDDDNLVIKKKFFKELLRQMIKHELNLKFIVGAFAIFALDDEMLELMVKAGCVGINVAIESGNQRVMNEVVLKPIKLEKVAPLIKQVQDEGLFVISNFIIGFPGETWEEIRETITFAENCGADYVKFFVAVPLKGTKLWDMATNIGAISGNSEETVDWRFSKITSNDWTSKDVSILRAYEWDRINFETPEKRKRLADLWGISEDEMYEIRKKTRDLVSKELLGTH